MSRILIFMAGALLGLAGALVFLTPPLFEPAHEHALAWLQGALPAALAPSPSEAASPRLALPPRPIDVPPTAPSAPGLGGLHAEASEGHAPQSDSSRPAALAGDPPDSRDPPFQPGALLIPVAGIQAGQLSDTFTDSRSNGRVHDAIDIMAPRGTPVVAAADGTVVKLFKSVPGGLTVYEFDTSQTYAFYYAHLDRYADGVVAGTRLKRGDLVGYVGSTGNASATAPHLHFAIFVLGADKHWWQGTAINPYPFLAGH